MRTFASGIVSYNILIDVHFGEEDIINIKMQVTEKIHN